MPGFTFIEEADMTSKTELPLNHCSASRYRCGVPGVACLALWLVWSAHGLADRACTAQEASKSDDFVQPAENLLAEGIPPIPRAIVDEVRRYTEARAASAFSWHPTKRQLLIGTRFGNSAQVHHLKRPAGARTQLTFFDEPVASASFEPTKGFYFVFSRPADCRA